MSKRLQVLLKEDEYREIRKIARRNRMTVAEWVRQALRKARREEPVRTKEEKLAALREALKHRHPAPDIEQMNKEIEQGYLSGVWPRDEE